VVGRILTQKRGSENAEFWFKGWEFGDLGQLPAGLVILAEVHIDFALHGFALYSLNASASPLCSPPYKLLGMRIRACGLAARCYLGAWFYRTNPADYGVPIAKPQNEKPIGSLEATYYKPRLCP